MAKKMNPLDSVTGKLTKTENTYSISTGIL